MLKKILMVFVIPVFYVIVTLQSIGKSKKYRGELQTGVWHEFNLKGVRNSYGKPSPVFMRRGTENKLMVFFSGGGASWSEETAAKPMGIIKMALSINSYYSPKVWRWMRILFTGLLSGKPENPFANWNVLYIPYVTGDFHCGNNEFKYNNGKKTLYHVGEINTRLIMDECKKQFPGADALLICGDRAGAFGCAANAPLVAGYYPDAPVTVYSDASQLVSHLWKETAANVWKANDKLVQKVEESGDLYYNLVEYACGELGSRASFLRSNTKYDDVLTTFESDMNGGPHTVTPASARQFRDGLIATEKRFMESELPYFAFITSHNKNKKTGMTQHTMCRNTKSVYFTGDVGVSLMSWVADAVNGNYRNIGRDELLTKKTNG